MKTGFCSVSAVVAVTLLGAKLSLANPACDAIPASDKQAAEEFFNDGRVTQADVSNVVRKYPEVQLLERRNADATWAFVSRCVLEDKITMARTRQKQLESEFSASSAALSKALDQFQGIKLLYRDEKVPMGLRQGWLNWKIGTIKAERDKHAQTYKEKTEHLASIDQDLRIVDYAKLDREYAKLQTLPEGGMLSDDKARKYCSGVLLPFLKLVHDEYAKTRTSKDSIESFYRDKEAALKTCSTSVADLNKLKTEIQWYVPSRKDAIEGSRRMVAGDQSNTRLESEVLTKILGEYEAEYRKYDSWRESTTPEKLIQKEGADLEKAVKNLAGSLAGIGISDAPLFKIQAEDLLRDIQKMRNAQIIARDPLAELARRVEKLNKDFNELTPKVVKFFSDFGDRLERYLRVVDACKAESLKAYEQLREQASK